MRYGEADWMRRTVRGMPSGLRRTCSSSGEMMSRRHINTAWSGRKPAGAEAGCRRKHAELISKWGRWLHRLVRSLVFRIKYRCESETDHKHHFTSDKPTMQPQPALSEHSRPGLAS